MKKIILIAILFTIGCSAEKRLAKKENKAWDIYSSSPRLISKSVPLVSALFPCIVKEEIVRTDTSFLYITDTLVNKIPYAVYKDKVLDTIIDNISILADSTGISVKYLGKDKVITKTIEKVKIDQSEINRANDSLQQKEVIIANLKGKYSELEKRLNETESDKNRWATYFWLLVSVIAILIGTALFFKFKPKIPLP
jgi:hypothetical protein